MLRIYQTALLTVFLLFTALSSSAQVPDNNSVNPALQEIYNSKTPVKYTIAGIDVSGTRTFDRNLIISISGLAIGDEVQIPGTDVLPNASTDGRKHN